MDFLTICKKYYLSQILCIPLLNINIYVLSTTVIILCQQSVVFKALFFIPPLFWFIRFDFVCMNPTKIFHVIIQILNSLDECINIVKTCIKLSWCIHYFFQLNTSQANRFSNCSIKMLVFHQLFPCDYEILCDDQIDSNQGGWSFFYWHTKN